MGNLDSFLKKNIVFNLLNSDAAVVLDLAAVILLFGLPRWHLW